MTTERPPFSSKNIGISDKIRREERAKHKQIKEEVREFAKRYPGQMVLAVVGMAEDGLLTWEAVHEVIRDATPEAMEKVMRGEPK